MTKHTDRLATIGQLLRALKWVKTVAAFKQITDIPDDDPAGPGHVPLTQKKQRGRPASQATLQRRALLETLASQPKHVAAGIYLRDQMYVRDSQSSLDGMYVKNHLSAAAVALIGESHIFEAVRTTYGYSLTDPLPTAFFASVLEAIKLFNVGAFANIRRDLGLDHAATPHQLVLDVLTLSEDPDPECEARHPNAPTSATLKKRTIEALEAKRSEIATNAQKSGQKVSNKTQRRQIEAVAPKLLQDLAAGQITPETMQTRLRKLPKSIPIPTVRSLRRMVQEKRGQKPAPK